MEVCDVITLKRLTLKKKFPLTLLFASVSYLLSRGFSNRICILSLTKNHTSATKPPICFISPMRSIQWWRLLKGCVFSRKAATPQQKQVEHSWDEKTKDCRVERAAMKSMLRQGEDSCWHGSVARNSPGEQDWNKFSDRLLKRLQRQDYIEPSYGSCSKYPTFMFEKKSAHYALNPNVESSSSCQRLQIPVLCFHQPCLDSG